MNRRGPDPISQKPRGIAIAAASAPDATRRSGPRRSHWRLPFVYSDVDLGGCEFLEPPSCCDVLLALFAFEPLRAIERLPWRPARPFSAR